MNLNDVLQVIPIDDEVQFAEQLAKALTFPGIRTDQKIERTYQYKYLLGYLYADPDGLNTKTIVIEKDYTSISYLKDYINYYAQCYHPYIKQCRRIHFLGRRLELDQFIKLLVSEPIDENWTFYLGNLVVRPLPRGVIGATLLSPYEKKSFRHYTGIKDYPINLFGKPLSVKTLLYQEQDGIVGSCASSALWFTFQKTSEIFETAVPSPSDITISAGNSSDHTGKNIPSASLEISQICKAIFSTGLISEYKDSPDFKTDPNWIKSFIYAYCRMGIPILVSINIEKMGPHMVAVNGYRFDENANISPPKKDGNVGIDLISNYITKFYAHDDQIGPFSRLEFISNEEYLLKTSWWKDVDSNVELRANLLYVIAPLKNSIKVTFDDILEQATILDFALSRTFKKVKFIWDIFLIQSNKYKDYIRKKIAKNPGEFDPMAADVLLKSLPQFIWVAQAKIRIGSKNYLIFDVIYDAIDVNFSNSPFFSNIYNSAFKTIVLNNRFVDEFSIFEHIAPEGRIQTDFFTLLNEDYTLLSRISDLEDSVRTANKTIEPSEITRLLRESLIEELRKSSIQTQNKINDV